MAHSTRAEKSSGRGIFLHLIAEIMLDGISVRLARKNNHSNIHCVVCGKFVHEANQHHPIRVTDKFSAPSFFSEENSGSDLVTSSSMTGKNLRSGEVEPVTACSFANDTESFSLPPQSCLRNK